MRFIRAVLLDLITYKYDQNLMDGPPFSVSNAEVNLHYQANYEVLPLSSVAVIGELKRGPSAQENSWLLKPLTIHPSREAIIGGNKKTSIDNNFHVQDVPFKRAFTY
jgi:hypothetical protein